MNKHNFTSVKLDQGEMHIYDLGGVSHVPVTTDGSFLRIFVYRPVCIKSVNRSTSF